MWGALAASALLITAAGLFVFGDRVATVVRDAVGDHRNCAIKFALVERPVPLAEAAVRYDPIYSRLRDTPPDEFVTAVGPLRVVDRHSCVFAVRRFGHVVLRLEGHLVSLLVTRDEQPSTRRSSASTGPPSWLPRVDGQQVASFPTPGHIVFVVSDLPEDQFRGVAQALTVPMSTRLAVFFRHIPSGMGD
jgi:hypothetical protein